MRFKLRHKETRAEMGPFSEDFPDDWFELVQTGQYNLIRSLDVLDRNRREIFVGDMLSIGDNTPFDVVENSEGIGILADDGFEELSAEYASICEVVGCDGCLF